jgi:iron(III) transport system ATP-binding protein
MSAIELTGLRKTFGHVEAVADVDLSIPAGELFFLLGPSGCGKTTLLRMIAGLVQPDRGTIHIGGENVTEAPPDQRRSAMVFQNYALWPHMTVKANVAFGLEVRRVAAAERATRVRSALETVHMTDFAARKPNQLSGGQQQRVALARALVVEPSCLLLDEPLSNLDAKLRAEMRTEIRRICKSAGLTTVYVTHDQKEALSIADRLAVMNNGRVEQVGSPRQLYTDPSNHFVADFLGDANFLTGRVMSIDGNMARVHTTIGQWTGRFSSPIAVGDQVTCLLRPESIRHTAPPNGISNVFSARMVDTVYLGDIAEHHLRVGDTSLKSFVLNPGPKAVEHTECSCWVETDDVRILPL